MSLVLEDLINKKDYLGSPFCLFVIWFIVFVC